MMNEREYENLQVKLDEYEDYMIKRITDSTIGVDIEDLEEMMEALGIHNKYKDDDK